MISDSIIHKLIKSINEEAYDIFRNEEIKDDTTFVEISPDVLAIVNKYSNQNNSYKITFSLCNNIVGIENENDKTKYLEFNGELNGNNIESLLKEQHKIGIFKSNMQDIISYGAYLNENNQWIPKWYIKRVEGEINKYIIRKLGNYYILTKNNDNTYSINSGKL